MTLFRPNTPPGCPLATCATNAGLAVPPGTDQIQVTGITGDSRDVQPGDLYVGVPGATFHGAKFAKAALAAGAVAVMTDQAGVELISQQEVAPPILVSDNPRADMAQLAASIYGHPDQDLTLFATTGTNGKTSTTFMIDAALRHLGHTTGRLGTIDTVIAGESVQSSHTTPESYDLQALLATMVERQVSHCSLEVSSHALALHRVDAAIFEVAGFTNLSVDHLDFHPTMDDYFETKAQLFTPERSRHGVVWTHDEWGQRLAEIATVPIDTLGWAHDPTPTIGTDHWIVSDADFAALGSTFTLTRTSDSQSVPVACHVAGDFNVMNAALAVVMLTKVGISLPDAARAVASCAAIPGRMQRVSADGSPLAIVDFAHTPTAVADAAKVLREITPGRLIVVLGAGGDRDRTKRGPMGAAAAEHADLVVITDDNPRSEDPAAIRAAVAAGAREFLAASERSAQVVECAGRAAAIQEAVAGLSSSDDTILLAGKGHEQGQTMNGTTTPFDDVQELRSALISVGFEAVEGI